MLSLPSSGMGYFFKENLGGMMFRKENMGASVFIAIEISLLLGLSVTVKNDHGDNSKSCVCVSNM